MYKDIFKDINTITSKYTGSECNELLKNIITRELIIYLNDFTILNELYPYELKLKEDIYFSYTGDIDLVLGIYNTTNKYFLEVGSEEWNSYKVQLLLKKYNLNKYISNQQSTY